MSTALTMDDIDIFALSTAVDLLDTLIDGCALAIPGRDARAYASDLRYLGDSTSIAARDLEALLATRPLPGHQKAA